jgi:hypothetical protein
MKRVLIALAIFLGVIGALLLFLRFLRLLLPKGRGLEFYVPKVGKDLYIPRVSKDFYIPKIRKHL